MVKEFLNFCDVHCYHVSGLCKCLLTNLYIFWSLGIWNGILGSWCTLCDHTISSGVFKGKYVFKRLCQMTSEIHPGKWGSHTFHYLLHPLNLISFPVSPPKTKCLSLLVQKGIFFYFGKKGIFKKVYFTLADFLQIIFLLKHILSTANFSLNVMALRKSTNAS